MSGPDLPVWLHPIAAAALRVRAGELSGFVPPADHRGRRSAVLILFGEAEHRGTVQPDLLLTERSHTMRSHAGQPAFPGGVVDPADGGPVGAALREAAEETGLDPSGVEVVTVLPDLWLPPSDFVVTPVLGWWHRPTPIRVASPDEVAAVVRVPLADLLDPANRFVVRHPSGFQGPAFRVGGLLVWGFTAGLLARLLRVSGVELPWDESRIEDLPDHLLQLALRSTPQPPGPALPGPP